MEKTIESLVRLPHKILDVLETPVYNFTASTTRDGYMYQDQNFVLQMLSKGSWLDTYIVHYANWDRYHFGGNTLLRWHVRQMAVWDLNDRYIVGIAMDSSEVEATRIRLGDYRNILKVWWHYFQQDKGLIFHLLRKARKAWNDPTVRKHMQSHPVHIGHKGRFGAVADFHTTMANTQLDEAKAEYRLIPHPTNNVAELVPLGIKYLMHMHAFMKWDCFSPIFLGQREATTMKMLAADRVPRKHNPDYNHVIYFQLT